MKPLNPDDIDDPEIKAEVKQRALLRDAFEEKHSEEMHSEEKHSDSAKEVEEDIQKPSKTTPPKQYQQPAKLKGTDSDNDEEGKPVKGQNTPKGLSGSKPLVNILDDPYTRPVKRILDFEDFRKNAAEYKKTMSNIIIPLTDILDKYSNETDNIETAALKNIKKILIDANIPLMHGNTNKQNAVLAYIKKYL